ncbi:MAG TPA: hypothetical protein DDX04_18825 [Massilia sp.]|nr:hypothetical protein [Massilia sp.]
MQLLLLGLDLLQLLHQRVLLLHGAGLGVHGLGQEAADLLQAAADDAAEGRVLRDLAEQVACGFRQFLDEAAPALRGKLLHLGLLLLLLELLQLLQLLQLLKLLQLLELLLLRLAAVAGPGRVGAEGREAAEQAAGDFADAAAEIGVAEDIADVAADEAAGGSAEGATQEGLRCDLGLSNSVLLEFVHARLLVCNAAAGNSTGAWHATACPADVDSLTHVLQAAAYVASALRVRPVRR